MAKDVLISSSRGIYKYHMQEAGSQEGSNLYIHNRPVNLTGQELVWVHDALLHCLLVCLYLVNVWNEDLRDRRDP